MNPDEDVFDQQLAEFHENLRAMAQHQVQVLAHACEQRMRPDPEPARSVVFLKQRLKGFIQQAKQRAPFVRQAVQPVTTPDEDELVIDVEFTVIVTDSGS